MPTPVLSNRPDVPLAPPPKRKDIVVRSLILIIGTLFVLSMAYGSGMRAQKRIVDSINEERKIAERDLRQAAGSLQVRLVLLRQLEARRLMHAALLELDRRNFGTAQGSLNQAVALLKEAGEAIATTQAVAPDLASVASGLAEVQLVASEDFGVQRGRVVALSEEADAKISAFLPSFLEQAAASDDALRTHLRQRGADKPTMNDVPQTPGNDVTRTR